MTLRVLILGANGFIGCHLLEALAGSDWVTPIAAGRRVAGPGGGPQYVRVDATDEAQLNRALANVTAVINCVAGSAETMIAVTRALLAAAGRQSTPPRLLHMSSMAVYGPATGLITESAPMLATDPYGRAKAACETLLEKWPSAVVCRPGIVYGPRGPQWTVRIARWLRSRRLGDLGAAGDGICNLVYVGDVVHALTQALRTPALDGRVFNLAMPDPPTWNEYLIAFARALRAVPVARIGARRLKLETKLLAPPLKIAELLGGRLGLGAGVLPEAIPPSLLRLFRQDIRLDATRAQRSLQLQWTTLAEGLTQSVRSLQSQPY